MVDTVKLKLQNRITSKNKNFIQSAIHRLTHFEKANLVRHKNVKKSIRTGQTEVDGKLKQSRSDTESTKRPKSIAVLIPLPMSNIPTTPDDIFDSNQAYLTAANPSSYKAADTCLSIGKEENMQDPIRLNISCILTNAYDKNQTNNKFHRVSYQTLCSSL